ncbi:helix-turn-helix transcriptional regulator [Paenibacillus qinlingensis]|uniref:helix-turn-helix transcriptional regulator n=1 Tax=Paenibacillus qinlingensis TaxID=1837343 RepID=UPI00156338C3|nr:AraC family transcriptional regulator [Paenibacillus qinlingensis]NQX63658.1 helix-turn-helix transcriptional regulator [Paenibacillus qinlingensis]
MSNFGIHLLWTARYDYEKGENRNLHQHAFHQIFWIASGSGVFQCEDVIFELEPDTIFFIKPNQLHGLTAVDHVKTLDIKFQIVSEELESATGQIPAQMRIRNKEVARLLELVRSEGLQRQSYFRELAALHLAELLYVLTRAAEHLENEAQSNILEARSLAPRVSNANATAAEKAEQWILAHADQDWTITEMSKKLGYSPSYMCQLFKDYKGLTIAAFLKEVRIQRAKEWMAYSDCSIKHIAQTVGFKTVHHFTRVFKEVEGITPGQWIAREISGIRNGIFFDDTNNYL